MIKQYVVHVWVVQQGCSCHEGAIVCGLLCKFYQGSVIVAWHITFVVPQVSKVSCKTMVRENDILSVGKWEGKEKALQKSMKFTALPLGISNAAAGVLLSAPVVIFTPGNLGLVVLFSIRELLLLGLNPCVKYVQYKSMKQCRILLVNKQENEIPPNMPLTKLKT